MKPVRFASWEDDPIQFKAAKYNDDATTQAAIGRQAKEDLWQCCAAGLPSHKSDSAIMSAEAATPGSRNLSGH